MVQQASHTIYAPPVHGFVTQRKRFTSCGRHWIRSLHAIMKSRCAVGAASWISRLPCQRFHCGANHARPRAVELCSAS
eukprot:929668-Rhodomonas_salina.2